ncbi:hypothetical protein M885DRAFT_519547 [Pelagophyceae sp. CCMP2097]|nr:hypothetical protein M885DRAFT_519547 [Pelagophyceae sp. CCMP2097]
MLELDWPAWPAVSVLRPRKKTLRKKPDDDPHRHSAFAAAVRPDGFVAERKRRDAAKREAAKRREAAVEMQSAMSAFVSAETLVSNLVSTAVVSKIYDVSEIYDSPRAPAQRRAGDAPVKASPQKAVPVTTAAPKPAPKAAAKHARDGSDESRSGKRQTLQQRFARFLADDEGEDEDSFVGLKRSAADAVEFSAEMSLRTQKVFHASAQLGIETGAAHGDRLTSTLAAPFDANVLCDAAADFGDDRSTARRNWLGAVGTNSVSGHVENTRLGIVSGNVGPSRLKSHHLCPPRRGRRQGGGVGAASSVRCIGKGRLWRSVPQVRSVRKVGTGSCFRRCARPGCVAGFRDCSLGGALWDSSLGGCAGRWNFCLQRRSSPSAARRLSRLQKALGRDGSSGDASQCDCARFRPSSAFEAQIAPCRADALAAPRAELAPPEKKSRHQGAGLGEVPGGASGAFAHPGRLAVPTRVRRKTLGHAASPHSRWPSPVPTSREGRGGSGPIGAVSKSRLENGAVSRRVL